MAMTLGAITLPAGLLWTDEYAWFPVARAIETSVTGTPIIQSTAQVAGRPITFSGQDAWLSKAALDALVALATEAGPHLLTLHDGRSVSVQFREPPLAAELVIPYEDPLATDDYSLTALNLITVGAITPAP